MASIQSSLPAGWTVQQDPQSNNWFYVNNNVSPPTASWTHPLDAVAPGNGTRGPLPATPSPPPAPPRHGRSVSHSIEYSVRPASRLSSSAHGSVDLSQPRTPSPNLNAAQNRAGVRELYTVAAPPTGYQQYPPAQPTERSLSPTYSMSTPSPATSPSPVSFAPPRLASNPNRPATFVPQLPPQQPQQQQVQPQQTGPSRVQPPLYAQQAGVTAPSGSFKWSSIFGKAKPVPFQQAHVPLPPRPPQKQQEQQYDQQPQQQYVPQQNQQLQEQQLAAFQQQFLQQQFTHQQLTQQLVPQQPLVQQNPAQLPFVSQIVPQQNTQVSPVQQVLPQQTGVQLSPQQALQLGLLPQQPVQQTLASPQNLVHQQSALSQAQVVVPQLSPTQLSPSPTPQQAQQQQQQVPLPPPQITSGPQPSPQILSQAPQSQFISSVGSSPLPQQPQLHAQGFLSTVPQAPAQSALPLQNTIPTTRPSSEPNALIQQLAALLAQPGVDQTQALQLLAAAQQQLQAQQQTLPAQVAPVSPPLRVNQITANVAIPPAQAVVQVPIPVNVTPPPAQPVTSVTSVDVLAPTPSHIITSQVEQITISQSPTPVSAHPTLPAVNVSQNATGSLQSEILPSPPSSSDERASAQTPVARNTELSTTVPLTPPRTPNVGGADAPTADSTGMADTASNQDGTLDATATHAVPLRSSSLGLDADDVGLPEYSLEPPTSAPPVTEEFMAEFLARQPSDTAPEPTGDAQDASVSDANPQTPVMLSESAVEAPAVSATMPSTAIPSPPPRLPPRSPPATSTSRGISGSMHTHAASGSFSTGSFHGAGAASHSTHPSTHNEPSSPPPQQTYSHAWTHAQQPAGQQTPSFSHPTGTQYPPQTQQQPGQSYSSTPNMQSMPGQAYPQTTYPQGFQQQTTTPVAPPRPTTNNSAGSSSTTSSGLGSRFSTLMSNPLAQSLASKGAQILGGYIANEVKDAITGTETTYNPMPALLHGGTTGAAGNTGAAGLTASLINGMAQSSGVAGSGNTQAAQLQAILKAQQAQQAASMQQLQATLQAQQAQTPAALNAILQAQQAQQAAAMQQLQLALQQQQQQQAQLPANLQAILNAQQTAQAQSTQDIQSILQQYQSQPFGGASLNSQQQVPADPNVYAQVFTAFQQPTSAGADVSQQVAPNGTADGSSWTDVLGAMSQGIVGGVQSPAGTVYDGTQQMDPTMALADAISQMQLGQQGMGIDMSGQQIQQTDYSGFLNGLGSDISATVDQQTTYQQY